MKCRIRASVSLAALVLSSMTAIAQDARPYPPPRALLPRPEWDMPGPMMQDAPGAQMPGADPFQLLENSPEVQGELGLTREQLNRLHLAARNFRTKLQELSHPRFGVPPEQARAEIERHVMDTRGMIARELSPKQLGRLQQIMLQLEGPCLAVMDRQLGQQLSLTPEQDRSITQACQQRALQVRSAFQPPPPDRGENFCRMMAANRDRVENVRLHADQEITALLDRSQQAMLVRLKGQKVRLEPPMPPECRPM